MSTAGHGTGRRPAALRIGERVYLRRPASADHEALAALRRSSRDFLAPWEPLAMAEPLTRPAFQALLRAARDPRYEKTLICRSSDEAIVGAINVNEIVRGPFQSGYLGYWIGAPYARKGYMREALQLALAHIFLSVGLHRVEANIMPRNAASLALARGAGFRKEGYSPRYLEIAGRWEDHERWALLAEDWIAAQPR